MIVDNYRPVQNLNSRVIKASFKVSGGHAPDNGAYHVTNYAQIAMGAVLVALFKLLQ